MTEVLEPSEAKQIIKFKFNFFKSKFKNKNSKIIFFYLRHC